MRSVPAKPTSGASAALNGILKETTTPEEAAAVREWLIAAAQEATNAAKR